MRHPRETVQFSERLGKRQINLASLSGAYGFPNAEAQWYPSHRENKIQSVRPKFLARVGGTHGD